VRQYPRIGSEQRCRTTRKRTKAGGWKTHTPHCSLCSQVAATEIVIQTIFLRGEDEAVKVCGSCRELALDLILSKFYSRLEAKR
jgi:hypothetical protein